MKEPTNQMLIDALCIVTAVEKGFIELERNGAGPNWSIYMRARNIVGHYAPMAMARIARENERSADAPLVVTDDQRREILAHSEYGVSPGQGVNAGTFRVIGYAGEVAGGFSSQRDAEDWVIRNNLGLESNEPDDDSPELTDEQLANLRPARGPGEPRVIEEARDIVKQYAPHAVVALFAKSGLEAHELLSPDDTPNAREIVERHAEAGSGFAREVLEANPDPRRRLIEADELVVTTRDVKFAIECQRAFGTPDPVHFNGLDFRVIEIRQAEFENHWVLKLLRWHSLTKEG